MESWVLSGVRPFRLWSPQRPWLPLPWDQWDRLEVASYPLSHLAWGHTVLFKFHQIRAGHDVQDCRWRHGFSVSNAWSVLDGVPPKELRWPLCTGWRLGWCRTLPMPVLIQCCGCCPVVVDWCLMLCYTQCNHSPAWSAQWPGTASEVSLSPPHFKWATTRMRLRASLQCVLSTLMCFLKERCESHHSPRNFIDSSTGRGVSNPHIWGSSNLGSGCSEMYDFALVDGKSKAIPCCPFLYCINCLL